MTSQEYSQICRAQRQAYFAWQSAPAGSGDGALKAYIAATEALKAAQA